MMRSTRWYSLLTLCFVGLLFSDTSFAQPSSFVSPVQPSITAPGTSGSQASAIQGVTGGVALGISGQVSLPTSTTVGVTSLPPLPTGTNSIGSVTVGNFPATQPVSGTVGVSSLPALPTGSNNIGSVSVGNFPATQPVSGNVGVTSLPALPAGANNIGSVSTVGAVGALTDASVTLGTTAALVVPAGTHKIVMMEINTLNGQVACSWTSATPTVFGAGSFTSVGQGQGFSLGVGGSGFVPNQALYCIAAAASTGITVQYN